MAFVMYHSLRGIHQMNLIDVKKTKCEVKQVTKLKQCVVRSGTYGIYLHFKLKCTVLSASEYKLKFEVRVQYRCTFFVLLRI